jgi:hypothetical protein
MDVFKDLFIYILQSVGKQVYTARIGRGDSTSLKSLRGSLVDQNGLLS